LTVKHILIDCTYFVVACQRYFSVSTLKEPFENVDPGNVIAFIKVITFYDDTHYNGRNLIYS